MRDDMRITAAAFGALFRGDMENFVVAATPGGIEAQEAAGQRELVASSHLPKDLTDTKRAQWEAIGFRFGEDVDDLFVSVTLPTGWTKRPTDHAMWSTLHDGEGRKRASLFYKAAFYDRSAFLRAETRYTLNNYAKGAPGEYRTVILDGDTEIHVVGARLEKDSAASEQQYAAADRWLWEHYPEWRNPFAYWD